MKLYDISAIYEIYKKDEYLKYHVEKGLAQISWKPSCFIILRPDELKLLRDGIDHIITLRYLAMSWRPCIFFESEGDAMIFCMNVK